MTMKVFNVNDVLNAADVNEYLVNVILAVKSGGTSLNSSTTMVADPDLSVTLSPNKSYLLDTTIVFTSPSAAQFKFAFNFPAGSVFVGYAQFSSLSGGFYGTAYSTAGSTLSTANVASSIGGGIDDFVFVRGLLITAGTGGGFTLKWAQNVSNGGNTTVRDKSSMLLTRVS